MNLLKTNSDLMRVPSLMSDFFDSDSFFTKMLPEMRINNIPSVNIKEDENKYQLEIAAPGLQRNDFKINVDNNVLEISAEKKEEKEEKDKNYKKREFNYTAFTRSFMLPEAVNIEAIKAEYKDGILYVTTPKKEEVVKRAKKQIAVS